MILFIMKYFIYHWIKKEFIFIKIFYEVKLIFRELFYMIFYKMIFL